MKFHPVSGHSRNTERQMGINEANQRKHVDEIPAAAKRGEARRGETRTSERMDGWTLQVVRFNFFAAAAVAVFSVYADRFYAMCNKIDTFMPLPGKIRVGISLGAATTRRTYATALNAICHQ